MATTPALTVTDLLRAALGAAHEALEGTMSDVTDEIANRPAPGSSNPVGSSYAHALLAEDGVVNGIMRGRNPLFASSWAGRTGTDRPMPMPGMVEGDMGEWYREVKVDLAACREYAKAVYASTDEFLDSADEETLNRTIDMSFVGMGQLPLPVMFSIFVTGHLNNMCGEISAAKGTQGLKGYPF
jgi:DinB family protein